MIDIEQGERTVFAEVHTTLIDKGDVFELAILLQSQRVTADQLGIEIFVKIWVLFVK